MSTRSTVERAFELARSGECRSIDDVRRLLKAEQLDAVDSHLAGATIKRQLVEAMRGA